MTRGSRPPINRTKRDDRISAWNASAAEGRRYQPKPVTGEGAKFEWIRAVEDSDLAPTTRHVAVTLALCGNSDGTRMFPGLRTIRVKTGLSLKSVSDHVDVLVRRGFLQRQLRHGKATAIGNGFEYMLLRPAVLKQFAHPAQVLKHVAHGVQRGAPSVQADTTQVCNDVAPTRYYQSKTSGRGTP